jgi:hypothetical protein
VEPVFNEDQVEIYRRAADAGSGVNLLCPPFGNAGRPEFTREAQAFGKSLQE